MLENPDEIAMIAVFITFSTFFFIILIGIINSQKKFISSRKFTYLGIPIMTLPLYIITTYLFFPKGSINFVLRFLAAMGLVIIGSLWVFIFIAPILEFAFFRREDDDKKLSLDNEKTVKNSHNGKK